MDLRLRQDHRHLGEGEKAAFVSAVLELKRRGVYDKLVEEHRSAMPPMGAMHGMGGMTMAHRSPWFLPWHRVFLLRFEEELREVDKSVALPYWNWLEDTDPSSSLWSPEFMGGDGDEEEHVTDGPFAFEDGWRLTVQSDGVHDPALRRAIEREPEDRLPSKEEIEEAIEEAPFDAPPWDDEERHHHLGAGFRPHLEHVVHDPVHGWVGGTMELSTSPNDPVFFLHHANLDRLWTVWQKSHEEEDPYLPNDSGTKYDADKPMPVYPDLPRDLVSSSSLGYQYDVEDSP